MGAIWRRKYISYISDQYFAYVAEYADTPEIYEVICDETRQLFGIICGSPMPLLEGVIFGPRGLLFQVFQLGFAVFQLFRLSSMVGIFVVVNVLLGLFVI